MDLEIIKEYGLSVFILIGAGKGLQVLYKNMREDAKTMREDSKKMFEKIQKSNKEREDGIMKVMEEEWDDLKDMNWNVVYNFNEINIIKTILEKLERKEVS